MREIGREIDGECHECGERTNCVYRCVELGVLFITPQQRLDPQKSECHDGQRRLVTGKVY